MCERERERKKEREKESVIKYKIGGRQGDTTDTFIKTEYKRFKGREVKNYI